jgi:cold shock protein
VDVVRTYLFASQPVNFDTQDEDLANRQVDFYNMLKEEYHYEVELYPINFKGRRLRKSDRVPEDLFEPKEKCVDISLATTMVSLGAIPHSYDIAIAVLGDRDFLPMFQNVRRLGKRVAIASIHDSCAPEYSDPRDEARVKDFDIIWIDALLHNLALKLEIRHIECASPFHQGPRIISTTYRPKKGQSFYCDECKKEFQKQKAEAVGAGNGESKGSKEHKKPIASNAPKLDGRIKRIVADRGYGFIAGNDGIDYFFHLANLYNIGFEDLREGDFVKFEIMSDPCDGKAGAANHVSVL